jgi:hypothetical protein
LAVSEGVWAPREGIPGVEPRRAAGNPGRTTENAVEWAKRALGFEADAVQAKILRSESRRGILNCSRQWGKSTVTAAKAMHRAWTRPESLVVVVSPTARQSGEFLRKAETFARELGIRPKGDGHNEMSLALPNGSRLVGLPGNEATVRGFSAVSLLLIDEASRVRDDLYYALRPMLAVSGGGLWLMSTPWGKRGFFWEEWTNGGPGWERVEAKATECARIQGWFLEEERRAVGERVFRREYLCEFEDAGAGVFDMDTVEKAMTDDFAPLEL